MSWYIGNEERAEREAAAGAHRAPSAYPETPAARAEREHREEQERSKQAATARVEAQRAADEQAMAEARQQRRADERAALEAEVREMFFASPAATEDDWQRRKEQLVDAEFDRRKRAAERESNFAQAALISEHL